MKARGFKPLIDRSEIYAFEDWWKRIEALIVGADTVVFVLSPKAVASEVALREVSFAASLNKRFAPIVYRPVDAHDVPDALAKLNFIFFDKADQFEESVDQLANALNTDISWIRQHTEFGEQARRWTSAKGASGLLLRSPVLEEAERWIASRPEGAPAPTEETQAFVRQSRRAATRRRNVLTGTMGAGLILALGLTGMAYWQRASAIEQRRIAVERRDTALLAQSRLLSVEANRLPNEGDAATAILLSLDALPDVSGEVERPFAIEADTTLYNALFRLREVRVLGGHLAAIGAAAFSPDGQRAVTAEGDTARIWDTTTGKQITTLTGHQGRITSVAWSSDGLQIVTASEDMTARLWAAETGKLITVMAGHTDKVWCAVLSSNGRRAITGSADRTVRVWDVPSGKERAVLEGGNRGVVSVAFSPDNRLILSFHERLSHSFPIIWDAETGNQIAILNRGRRENSPAHDSAFHPKGTLVVTAVDNEARLWEAASGKTVTVLRGHEGLVNSVAFSFDDGRVITASDDGTARIWDTTTGSIITILRHSDPVYSAAFSSDGNRVMTVSADKTARIWDVASGETITVLKGHESKITGAAFSPDGRRVLTASDDGTARIWQTDADPPTMVLDGEYACFSPDSRHIVTKAGDETARIWDVETGKSIAIPPRVDDVAAFSADGRRVVTTSDDGAARISDIETGKSVVILRGHARKINGAAFSADGLRVVTASDDKTGAFGMQSQDRPPWSSDTTCLWVEPYSLLISGTSRRQATGVPKSGTPKPARELKFWRVF